MEKHFNLPTTLPDGTAVGKSTTYPYASEAHAPSWKHDDPANYDGDRDVPSGSSGIFGSEASESSEVFESDEESDGGILMIKRKKTPAPARSSVSISNAELARRDVRKAHQSHRQRSVRSGSNGTVKKVGVASPGEMEVEGRRES